MSLTILIAAAPQLAALTQRADLADALTFADTDVLKALDAITRQRPQIIALDPQFAASARGAAFINRVKADPALASCEIRVLEAQTEVQQKPDTTKVQPDTTTVQPTPAIAIVEDDAPIPEPAPAAPSTSPTTAAPAAPQPPLDRTGTRRAERLVVQGNVEVLIDGNPATLVNISLVGAQVLSPSLLRPNQRVRMSLVDATRPMRFNGVVAWAAFEMPKGGPRYRAGVNFYDAAPDMVQRFIESITAS